MLCVDLFGIYFSGESGSISAVDVGDGTRYWRLIGAGFEYGETIKAPVVAGAWLI